MAWTSQICTHDQLQPRRRPPGQWEGVLGSRISEPTTGDSRKPAAQSLRRTRRLDRRGNKVIAGPCLLLLLLLRRAVLLFFGGTSSLFPDCSVSRFFHWGVFLFSFIGLSFSFVPLAFILCFVLFPFSYPFVVPFWPSLSLLFCFHLFAASSLLPIVLLSY